MTTGGDDDGDLRPDEWIYPLPLCESARARSPRVPAGYLGEGDEDDVAKLRQFVTSRSRLIERALGEGSVYDLCVDYGDTPEFGEPRDGGGVRFQYPAVGIVQDCQRRRTCEEMPVQILKMSCRRGGASAGGHD